MAAALLAQIVQQPGANRPWQISSAGTWAIPDLPAMSLSQKVMSQKGIDLSSHRSRRLTAELMKAADVILAMTQYQVEAIRAEFPEVADKTLLISQLIGQAFDIDDPIMGTEEDYRRCADDLAEILTAGYNRLEDLMRRT
jgi:protein-tyrosine-phosphatase